MDTGRSRVVPGIRARLASVAVAAALVLPLASADAVLVDATAALPPDTSVALPHDTSAVAHARAPNPLGKRRLRHQPKKNTGSFESHGRFGRDSAIDLPWHRGRSGRVENRHRSPSIDRRRLELRVLNSSRPTRGRLVRPAHERQRARQVQHPARRRDVRLRGHGEGRCRRRRVLLQPQHGIRPGGSRNGAMAGRPTPNSTRLREVTSASRSSTSSPNRAFTHGPRSPSWFALGTTAPTSTICARWVPRAITWVR